MLFILFLIYNIGVYQIPPKDISQNYLLINALTYIMIIIALALSYVPQVNRWYEWYIGISGVVAIAVSSATANIGSGESAILTYAGIIYIVIVLYGFVCIRFRAAMIIG